MDILARIMLRVKVNDVPHPVLGTPCWEWQGCRCRGYGQMCVKQKMKFVHRLMYTEKVGPITTPCVLHKCDNPPCCNPDHLFLGTMADNCADRDRKGRQVTPRGDKHWSKLHPHLILRGESNPFAKLTDDQVDEIRKFASSMRRKDLAKMFGVHKGTIGAILTGKRRQRRAKE